MTWLQIADRLRDSVPWRDESFAWLPALIYVDPELKRIYRSAPTRLQAFREAEAPYATQIEQAIQQWLATGSLPKLEQPASYFLSLRFHSLGFYLTSFARILDDSKTGELGNLLIEDWRDKDGPSWAVGFSFVEHDFDEEGD